MGAEPAFAKKLEAVRAKIRAAPHVDRILGDISDGVCEVFEADRLTIYLLSYDRTMIVSKLQTGLDSRAELRLPVSSDYSVASYVAHHKTVVNIKNAYDEDELRAFEPPVYFHKAIDDDTGYATQQMLAAPIVVNSGANEVLGVVQLINTKSGRPFPRAAEDGITALCDTLAEALTRRDPRQRPAAKSKYDHLVIDGVMAAAELDLAIRLARRKSVGLEQILISEFQVSEAALGRALSQYYGLPYEPYRPDRPRPATALRRLKRSFLLSEEWVPIEEDETRLAVMTPSPERVMSSQIVNQVFARKQVEYRVCTARDFAATVEHSYSGEDTPASVDAIIRRMLDSEAAELPREGADERVEPDSVTVQMVNKFILDAHGMGASDIHIEPRQGTRKTRIRFRVDGLLTDYVDLPASHHAKVVARLKIMANLDISNRREPQDGKIIFQHFHPGTELELRVATIPTASGKEDVVLRLLRAGKPVPIDELGLQPRNLAAVKTLMAEPHGLFLVCGPTGSGKTTTMHSVLGHLNTPETKIWTAEDPVEITQEDLRQVQINPRTELTFARAMRAFLRADPDVIMVGEMRDRETAAIGIEASLTGHLVLATLHTNSAPESIQRLLDMGMDPYNFAEALLGIMAQRLARRLCVKCKKPRVGTQEQVLLMLDEYCGELKNADRFKGDPKAAQDLVYGEWRKNYAYGNGQFLIYQPTGCEACRDTGYRGRIGLHELLVATPAVKKKIIERAPAAAILATALDENMRTLRQDGIEKVLQGLTDMQEVRAVCIK